ncbi:MAG: tetratricopeptide repeat protein [Isosphaeraceae bacterium]|nr:tetratricopeptide repeat protein [Isosphaeraceae bacterium]
MNLPDGRPLVVSDGILHEPSPAGRLVLWLPGERDADHQHWERVGTVVRAAVSNTQGVCSIEVTSVAVRERLGTSLGQAFRRLVGGRSDRALTLPNGKWGEPCGARRYDRRFAWAEDEAAPLDEMRIRAIWPEVQEYRSLGPNLYLLGDVGQERVEADSASRPEATRVEGPSGPDSSAELSPQALAERSLETARRAGDRAGEVTALIDLALVFLKGKQPRLAVPKLREALAEARRLGDRAREADAESSLALALLILGRPDRAKNRLERVLAYVRETGDRYAEKLATERLAEANLAQGEVVAARTHFEEAASIAADLGDVRHEAGLLWRAAIVYAEEGHRDQAIARAEASVERLRRLGNPTADWYAHHLANYRSGKQSAALTATAGEEVGIDFTGSFDVTTSATAPRSGAVGPSLLRMALTAAQSMKAFVGSGFKTASVESYRGRLSVCDACEHHTGIRCRLCGCITVVKAKLNHERCPLGRWPA